MARNTISTFTYTIPIDIKWKCSKCGYNNEVSQTISIEGEASTRSPRKKDLDLNNEKAKSIALDEVDKWQIEYMKQEQVAITTTQSLIVSALIVIIVKVGLLNFKLQGE